MLQTPGFQPPGGGFFGSMMSGNPGAGSPQSFTSPPVSPQLLSLLKQLTSMGGAGVQQAMSGGAPNMSALPPNSTSISPMPGGAPAMPGGGMGAPMSPGGAGGGLDPAMLQKLLMMLKGGMGGAAPAPAPGQ